jgi:serine kinase of HPr protein (carbohydrate metabolism regulator)
VLIRGPSGSGKTTLALALMRRARLDCHYAALIADDQLFIEAQAGRLLAFAPAAIAGLAEVNGLEPRAVAFHHSGQIDLVVELVADQVAPRFQETVTVSLAGVHVAGLTLRSRSVRSAVLAIAAWLNWPPFDE